MSVSRFQVQKVSESDTKDVAPATSPAAAGDACAGVAESDTTRLVDKSSGSGPTTATETKRLVPADASVSESVEKKSPPKKDSELLLGDPAVEAEQNVEKPPPYTMKDTLIQKEESEEGLVMKAVESEEQLEPNTEVKVETVTEKEDVDDTKQEKGKSRFHVEFVDKPQEDESQSPPLSPNHDSTTNSHNTHSKTYYLRTFGHNTQEAIPMVAYYRNSSSVTGKSRPTLDQLHESKDALESPTREGSFEPTQSQTDLELGVAGSSGPIKFGWIKGVLIRCLLNIWGVMLFLRLSWVVGQAGIGLSLVVILLSAVVTVITTLSMSAICTNGQVRGGGAYYLISRSLGPEFGGAIGLIFSLANAVAVAMYVVGFAETVVDLMVDNGASMTQNVLHDTRIIGAITVILLLGVTQLGMAWEAKAQILLLIILLISIVNFVVGTFIPASLEKQSSGFFNYQGTVAAENFGPKFDKDEDFFSVFAIFFPAATGILAGCNISGDLKDAQTAIPKGTLLAILISTIVYCVLAVMLGCVEVREASSNITDLINATDIAVANCTGAACGLGWDYQKVPGCDDVDTMCYPAGLIYDTQAMQKISGLGPIVTAGIFAATLSSALASLVSAPKIFQAVCRDKLFPGITFFGKGAPKSDEPRRGYILAFIIAMAFILIGSLDSIAPIISNFFLASYTLINYSCFGASLSKSPGWRPAFKYYNMWMSLCGSFICCGIMFVINWWAALITIAIVLALYKYVDYKKPDVNWGSSTQAYLYKQALTSALKLSSVEDHVKNFRPQTLVLSGPPNHRPALVHFASQFTKNVAMMMCANIIQPQSKNPFKSFSKQRAMNEQWLKKQRIKSFYTSVVTPSFKTGADYMMQSAGMGKIRTNTLLLGFKRDWREDTKESLMEYIDVIHDAFDLNYAVCILRLKEGLDVSKYITDSNTPDAERRPTLPSGLSLVASTSDFSTNASNSPQDQEYQSEAPTDSGTQDRPVPSGATGTDNPRPSISSTQVQPSNGMNRSSSKLIHSNKIKGENAEDVNPQILKDLNQFQGKQEKGKTIDVWWLFDDGGLTILLPYLLSIKQQWSGCHLRVFTGGKQSRIDQEKRTMAQLLSKFRIDFKDVIVIGDIGVKPKKSSVKEFEDMIRPMRMNDGEMTEEERQTAKSEKPWKITDDELEVLKEKTNRQIRIRELLQQHSMDAALVVMMLPMARKGACSASLYMAWLEELSKDMPPMLLMRGNQTSVLTFYS